MNYQELRSLVGGDNPQSASYQDIVSGIQSQYRPQTQFAPTTSLLDMIGNQLPEQPRIAYGSLLQAQPRVLPTPMTPVKNVDAAASLDSGQINATTFLLKKTKENVDLINEWFRVSSLEWTIDDTPSDIANDPTFCDHRHDQSVFSLLRKKIDCFTIEDETYPSKTHDWADPVVRNVPVLATRRKF